ncbi:MULTISPECIES: Hsp70 family protein [Nocardiopsis]|uniref:Hsp70 family protein n=1 Tax=Nocardiopsis changdeensis TaxID=2831969 RepID=A0ABX8BX42_9ACTN|nr:MULTISPECIES: Hsp70 family protein [Nocardiopsis]QUX24908.1 Hsp70 family protein [Nocardiopsis changdeensis]QYX35294.1 Hsp70 family protein [Nocardiopsis sp. MT53]
MSFGIDFGTTNSVLARWNGEEAEVVALDSTNLDHWNYPAFASLFPSMVGVSSVREEVLFGWEAKLRSQQATAAAKRLLAGDEHVQVGQRSWHASTVAAGIFRTMRDRAEEEHFLELDSAVVTVPANSAGAARFRTRAAAREAGIKVDSLINEPTAAALYYKQQLGDDGLENIVTFDWGGGTIDVTVMEAEGNGGLFEERAARGVPRLGGLELDDSLARLVMAKAGRRPKGLAERTVFAREIELAKIRLSNEAVVAVPAPGGRTNVEITREEFEKAIRPVVERAVEPLRRCLADLDLVPEDVDSVLMIGGSSQIPLVRRMVGDIMGDRIVSSDLCDPMTSVAQGAAVAAAINGGDVDIDLAVGTTHALGTVSTRRIGPGEEVRSFSQIIPRNATLPRSQEKNYRPNDAGQKRIGVEIWEGDPADPVSAETGADNRSNICLTRLPIDLPPFRDPEEASFTLTYTYDLSGLLGVRAVMDRDGTVLVDREIDAFGLSTTGVGVSAASLREFLQTRPRIPGDDRIDEGAVPIARPGARSAVPSPVQVAAAVGRPSSGAANTPSGTAVRGQGPLVVDGSNLSYGGRGKASLTRLYSALDELRVQNPGVEIVVVVDANFRHVVAEEERSEVDRDISEGALHRVPSRTVGGADVYLLEIARRKGGTVVSNDGFREHTDHHSWLSEPGRLLGAEEIAGMWVFKERRPTS